jgi:starch phosphorylase
MKACMRKLAPVFNTNRMVRDYAEKFYVPASARGAVLKADGYRRGVELARAKDKLRSSWPDVRIVGVHTSGNGHCKVGQQIDVEALIDVPGDIKPEELKVELYHGRVSATGELESARPLVMKPARQMGPNRYLFTGNIECRSSGRQGFAVRVLPGLTDLATPFEPGLIIWN